MNRKQLHQDWIGVDLDGTLATYYRWISPAHIGEPIPAMVDRVKLWLALGITVKIFTARACRPEPELCHVVNAINVWCVKHIGQVLEVTNVKDFGMRELWDDRAVSVEFNTGRNLRLQPGDTRLGDLPEKGSQYHKA